MIDQVAEFAQQLPAWCDEKGLPLTYRHFIYGMKWIRRHYARQSIRMAESNMQAQTTKEDYKTWVTEQNSVAGYT